MVLRLGRSETPVASLGTNVMAVAEVPPSAFSRTLPNPLEPSLLSCEKLIGETGAAWSADELLRPLSRNVARRSDRR